MDTVAAVGKKRYSKVLSKAKLVDPLMHLDDELLIGRGISLMLYWSYVLTVWFLDSSASSGSFGRYRYDILNQLNIFMFYCCYFIVH